MLGAQTGTFAGGSAGLPVSWRSAAEKPAGSEPGILRKDFPIGRHSGRRSAGGSRACRRWFIALYSDYRDDRLDAESRAEMIAHMAECASCRRYDRVIRRGVAVLRDSAAEVPDLIVKRSGDEDDPAVRAAMRGSEPVASGVAVASTLLVIGLNALASWVPLPAREMEGLPVAAAEPSPGAAPVSLPLPPLLRIPRIGPETAEPGGEVAPPLVRIPVVVQTDPD